MAEWLGTGLQNQVQQFDSAWYLIKETDNSVGFFYEIPSHPLQPLRHGADAPFFLGWGVLNMKFALSGHPLCTRCEAGLVRMRWEMAPHCFTKSSTEPVKEVVAGCECHFFSCQFWAAEDARTENRRLSSETPLCVDTLLKNTTNMNIAADSTWFDNTSTLQEVAVVG